MSGREERGDGDADRTVRAEALLCDVMLGSLVTYLRMCGYDAADALDRGIEADERLLELAREEGRTLLTRDRQLAARARTDGTETEPAGSCSNPARSPSSYANSATPATISI